MSAYLKVELLHGGIGRDQTQKDTLRGLGLRHRHQQRILKNTPAIRGMIHKVFDLVRFEETKDSELPKVPKVVTYRLGVIAAPQPKKEKIKRSAAAPEEKAPAKAAHPHPKKETPHKVMKAHPAKKPPAKKAAKAKHAVDKKKGK